MYNSAFISRIILLSLYQYINGGMCDEAFRSRLPCRTPHVDCRGHGDQPRASAEPAELHRCRKDAPVHAGHEVGTPFDGCHDLSGGRCRNRLDIPIKPLGAIDRWQRGAMFVPLHIAIWSKFPVWYHLTFLLTIIPAVLVGALLPALGNKDKDLNEGYSAPR